MIKLGTQLPEHLIGTDHGAFAAFVAGLEDMGYGYVTIGDHVLGADLSVRPEWRVRGGRVPMYDHTVPWHEPLVLFGYLAAITKTLELATGILVSPQRQTALLAKQAAEVDILSGGRLRLVVAAGWNDVEFEGLGVSFADRGKILEEQAVLLRRYWTEDVVTYRGAFHTAEAVGIQPLPVQRPIPLWFGGQSPAVLRRTGRLADGWFPYYGYFHEDRIRADLAIIHDHARAAHRDPGDIGLEGSIYFVEAANERSPGDRLPPVTLDECVEYAHGWKALGATRYWVTAPWADIGPDEMGVRDAGHAKRGIDDRLEALRAFKDAIGPDF